LSAPFTLRQLEYFDAIANEGSLAAAAERCRVSPSALGLAIDELERHLALQLVVRRKGKGVVLTPAGTRVLQRARWLLSGAESLADEARQASQGISGRLDIGVYSTLAPFVVPGILERFRQRHIDLEIDFVEGAAVELRDHLLQGRLDVALMYQVDVPNQLAFDEVHAYRPHVLLPAGHRFSGRSEISLGELVSEPLVMLDMPPARHNTEQIFRSLDLRPWVAHHASSYELARCLVGRGLGYSVMFQRPRSTTTYDGHEIVALDIVDRIEPTIVGLARPAGAPLTARHRALLEFLRRQTSEAQEAVAASPR